MKVKSKLQINTIISFSIIFLIILMILLIHQQEGKELSKGELASEIVKGTFELSILTNDLLLHNEERAQEQWELKYNSLNKLLTETEFESRETQDALDNIQKHFEKIKFAFNKLVDIKQKRHVLSHDQIVISQELEERVIIQMSINSQSMVTHAYELENASMRVVKISMRREGLLTLSFFVVIVISVGVALFFFNKQIVKPIEKLQKGIHAVAGGNLDHKVGMLSNDEIGQLSADFDLMTEKLKTITVSKDKMAKEITMRKKAEKITKTSLKEKEVLLKEIHHRVKNNMQIMASLLRLQSEGIKDKHLLDLFNEGRNRIKSMALIHEDLYQGKDLASIDFDQYTRTLTARLTKSLGADPNRIITSVNIDNVFLGVDKAIPCGLIINELFTNSLKYAFPLDKFKDKKGQICIDCHSNSAEHTLVFSDNGVGLPEDIDFQKAETLGLELVRALAEQLKGTIELNKNNGTEFKITFKIV